MEKRNLIKEFMKGNNISLQDLKLYINEELKELKKEIEIFDLKKLSKLGPYNENQLHNKLCKYNDRKITASGIISYLNNYFFKINDNEIYFFDVREKKFIKNNNRDEFLKKLELITYGYKIFFEFEEETNKDYLYNYNVINEPDKPFIFYEKYKNKIIKRYFNLCHINNPLISLDDLNIIKYNSIVNNVKELIKNYINDIPDNKKHLKQTIFISKLLKTYNNLYNPIDKKELINNIDIKKNNVSGLFDVFVDKGNEQYCFKFYIKDIHF